MIVISSGRVRRIIGIVFPMILIPALVLITSYVFPQNYALNSLLIVICALVLFVAGFDRREIGTRRAVLVSVMTALSVIGRLFPVMKPVSAITILSGMYLGAESGFLVGALSAVLSDFFMGQGPWTPFQMLSWGLIGLGAGWCAPLLCRRKWTLLVYGALSGAAFSMLMDIWTTIWTYGRFSAAAYLTAIVSAVPFTLQYAVSNVIFLWGLGKPMGDKFKRIQKKYGL
ncbi:MAG: ECF transporter S component [Oscillospiraceae bacterium]|nr:ECF transporter S component [Oscillospiraceae bacterium]